MNLEFAVDKKTLVVRVGGELDMLAADKFRRKVDLMVEKNCTDNIILNLQGVNFIDSSGLGVILGRYKNAAMRGGQMAIVDAPPQVRRILELSGVMGITKTYDTEKQALEAI